jgi:hypothetical protein
MLLGLLGRSLGDWQQRPTALQTAQQTECKMKKAMARQLFFLSCKLLLFVALVQWGGRCRTQNTHKTDTVDDPDRSFGMKQNAEHAE